MSARAAALWVALWGTLLSGAAAAASLSGSALRGEHHLHGSGFLPAETEEAPFQDAALSDAEPALRDGDEEHDQDKAFVPEAQPVAAPTVPWADLEAEAWFALANARKSGPHHLAGYKLEAEAQSKGFRALFDSAYPIDWYFLWVTLGVLVLMDVTVFQQLPETARSHVILLIFWMLIASCFCTEVWFRLGPEVGFSWLIGYGMEVIFSFDNIFVVHLIFSTFETPRRLMAKALFLGLLASIAFRFACLLGLASLLDRIRVIPYVWGLTLVYCGTKHIVVHEAESVDVTQTAVVRTLRGVLGDRLGEFYDEEGEAVLTIFRKKFTMTLLGVVVLCLVIADFLLAPDVVLAKAEVLQNGYLNFSSSALAVFAVRALFFVARDIFNRFTFTKYGIGLVLLFMGAENLLAHAIYVSALLSCAIIGAITAISVCCSSLREPSPKEVL